MNYREMAEKALERRARLFEEAKATLDSETLSGEERAKVERIYADMDALEAEAKGYVERAKREDEALQLRSQVGSLTEVRQGVESPAKSWSLNDEIRKIVRGESRGFDLNLDGLRNGPIMEQRVALTSAATNAGNAIGDTFVAEYLRSLTDASSFLTAGPRLLTTTRGEAMTWPVKTGVPSAARIGENQAIPTSDGSVGTFTLNAYKYATIVQFSREMEEDESVDFTGELARDAGSAIGTVFGTEALTADGTDKPNGLLTAATKKVDGAAQAPTFDEMMDLLYSLTRPYRAGAAFFVNDSSVKALRKIKDAENRYMWETSVKAGEPDVLFGRPAYTDVNMPAIGPSANSVLLADVSKYVVRQVRGLRVERSTEFAFANDLVSVKVVARMDGDLQDTSAAVYFKSHA